MRHPDGIDDPEGHILAAIREGVGSTVPILAQLDIHSNVSPQMVDAADVLIGRETYPEIDMAERSRECADVLMSILNDGKRPTMAPTSNSDDLGDTPSHGAPADAGGNR